MTKITNDQVLAIAAEAGCNVDSERLKTYHVITCGENRKAIYVAKSKRVVTRIDFSGFEVEESSVIKALSKEEAKNLHLGAVRGQIIMKNLRASDEEVLEAFEYGLFELMSEEEGFKLGKKKTEEESEEEMTVELGSDPTLQALAAADDEVEESIS